MFSRDFRPYVLAPGKCVSDFLLDSKNVGELEESALVFTGRWLCDTDETTALVNPLANFYKDFRVYPVFATAPGAVGRTPVYDYAYVVADAFLANIIEADKFRICLQAA